MWALIGVLWLVVCVAGLVSIIYPLRFFRIRSRARGLAVAFVALVGMVVTAALDPNTQPRIVASPAAEEVQIQAATPAAARPAAPQALDKIDTPPQQNAFIIAVADSRKAYLSAKNEMAAGAERQKRGEAICRILKNRNITNWTGFITDLSSNSDGFGVLKIKIGENIYIGTWNNAISDSGSDTLIKNGTKVMTEASKLSKGQAVKFSGIFIRGDVDCVRESSVTISGSMKSPDFIFRFSDIERIGELYVQPNSEKKSWLRSLF